MPDTKFRMSPPSILVVDDEEINREILAALLASEGYTVLHACDGEAALQSIAQNKIDLVLLDVMMPGMNGYDVCDHIREVMKKLELPVIFITALNDSESRVHGKAVGCDDFLTKPIDPTELNVRVRNLLRMKEYHDLRAHQKELLEEELERTRNQLLRADRMATLGTLAAGVGHELNNILTVLQMTLELMRTRSKQNLPLRDSDMERLGTVAQHVGTHAKHLLNYGRPGPQFAERIDLREIVKQTLEMLTVAGKAKMVELETSLPAEPVWVEVNRTRIEQVIVNLVGNAVDAVTEFPVRPRRVRVAIEPAGDGRVSCSISDNGCGIPQDKIESVFNPYYTTKPVGKGTGLGLAVVKNIVESYDGGKVSIISTVGAGTTVTFGLPVCTGTKQ